MIINDNMNSDDINAIVYEAVETAAEAVANLIDVLESAFGTDDEEFMEPYHNFMSQLQAQSVSSGGDRIDLVGRQAFLKLILGKSHESGEWL